MKSIRMIVVLLTLLSVLAAQKQNSIMKIACIDIQTVIDRVAKDRVLTRILEKSKKEILKKAEELSREIQIKEDMIEKERENLPKDRIALLTEEIVRLKEQLKAYLEEQEMFLRDKNNEVSVEALKSVYDIIEFIARQQGFSMILEKNTAVLYADEQSDITGEVLDELQKRRDKIKTD